MPALPFARSVLVGFLLVGALLHAPAARAEAPPATIDLYTMGPGDVIFSRFGHAAICVTPAGAPEAAGRCYNYGTADFSTPLPLTYNFVRGRAMFWVSVVSLPRMVDFYVSLDRTLYRQRLPLRPAAARRLARALAASTDESVRYYRYHHFHDNCTTRIRDLLDQATDGRLRRGAERHDGPTFRDLARRGFAGDLPLLLTADLLLGSSADEHTSRWQEMFLPDAFRAEVEQRLGARPVEIYTRRAPLTTGATWIARAAMVAAGALLAALVVVSWRRRPRLGLLLCGGLLGLVGLVLALLAVASAFPELRYNQAALVLLPTDLALPLLYGRGRLLRGYLWLRLGGLGVVALLCGVGVILQPLGAPLCLVGLPLGAALGCASRYGRVA